MVMVNERIGAEGKKKKEKKRTELNSSVRGGRVTTNA